jgi:hypothetical protein
MPSVIKKTGQETLHMLFWRLSNGLEDSYGFIHAWVCVSWGKREQLEFGEVRPVMRK